MDGRLRALIGKLERALLGAAMSAFLLAVEWRLRHRRRRQTRAPANTG
jgi:hypothetical protein